MELGETATKCRVRLSLEQPFPLLADKALCQVNTGKYSGDLVVVDVAGSFSFHGATAPSGSGPLQHRGFTITLSYTHHTWYDSSGRGIGPSQRPLPDNANTHKRQTSMPPVGLEPASPASARPQTHALDRAATGIGVHMIPLHTTLIHLIMCR
jgi:hypothetical protein